MKILHILDHSVPLHSGYAFRTLSILRHQRALGWETSHITSSKHPCDGSLEEQVDGFGFHRTPQVTGLRHRLPVLKQMTVIDALARRLNEIVSLEQPDVLHAHSPCLNGIAALRIARRRGIPLVYECRAFWEDAALDHGTSSEGGLRYRLTRALETHVFRHSDAITTICEGLRNDIVARGIDEIKVTVIPNAVDVDRFTENPEQDRELAASFGLQGKTVLGFIGSFYAYEGLPLLLQALPEILSKNPDVRVLLVGGGPQESHVRRLARELGVAEHVVFVGRVPHNEVQRYYDLVDIFVYPRISMRLTELVTPLKPLEAMAGGRLVLASDVGGHRELIRHEQTGYLFEAGNREALVDAALALMTNREQWSAIRTAGRRFVEAERSWSISVARYQSVYARLDSAGYAAA